MEKTGFSFTATEFDVSAACAIMDCATGELLRAVLEANEKGEEIAYLGKMSAKVKRFDEAYECSRNLVKAIRQVYAQDRKVITVRYDPADGLVHISLDAPDSTADR